jgi:hypothetical protein
MSSQIESLEDRVLLATATFDSLNGIIRITGTRRSDAIYCWMRRGRLRISANGAAIGGFKLRRVQGLTAELGSRNDLFKVSDGVPLACSVYGGGGNDTLVGAGDDDTLQGSDGDDDLRAMGGNDGLDGGRGNDHLQGAEGDDELSGGAGNDHLQGMEGNDNISGDAGNDLIEGGAGRDGVFGGIGGADSLAGGPGDDRFLLPKSAAGGTREDVADDFSTAEKDVRTWFVPGDKDWTDDEVMQIDGGLRVLHLSVDGTELLRHPPGVATSGEGRELGFYRFAELGGSAAKNGGRIRFADAGIAGDYQTSVIVIHEIGHNWEFYNLNPYWAKGHDFHALSGWTARLDMTAPAPEGMAISKDGQWLYRKPARFASDYARTNAMEDFAESFVNYFTHPQGGVRWQAKWDYMNDFLADIRVHPDDYA